MEKAATLHPQYITDDQGARKGVVLSIEEFEELLEDLEDLAAAAERKNEPTIPHDQVVFGLRRDGLL